MFPAAFDAETVTLVSESFPILNNHKWFCSLFAVVIMLILCYHWILSILFVSCVFDPVDGPVVSLLVLHLPVVIRYILQ